MHLRPQTGNQLVHCQTIKVQLIFLLIRFFSCLLAQLFEPNVRLLGNPLDRVLQLCLDFLPMLGAGHSPSCVPLPVRVLDQHLQTDLANE